MAKHGVRVAIQHCPAKLKTVCFCLKTVLCMMRPCVFRRIEQIPGLIAPFPPQLTKMIFAVDAETPDVS